MKTDKGQPGGAVSAKYENLQSVNSHNVPLSSHASWQLSSLKVDVSRKGKYILFTEHMAELDGNSV